MPTGTVTLPADRLRALLGRVEHAADSGYNRPVLSSVMLEVIDGPDDPKLRAVAADNFRIAIATGPVEATTGDFGQALVILDDVRLIRQWIKGLVNIVSLERKEEWLSLTVAKRALSVGLMDGTYPAYAHVVEKAAGTSRVGIDPRLLAGLRKGYRDGALVMRVGTWGQPVAFEAQDGSYAEYIMPVRMIGSGLNEGPAGPVEAPLPEAVAE